MKHQFPLYVLVIAILALLALICSPVVSLQAVDPLDVADRALGLAEEGDFDGARTTLASVPKEDGDNSPLLLTVHGCIELAAGKSADADPFFRSALTADPQQFVAMWGLSLSLLQRGRVYEASALLSRAAAIAPTDTRIKLLQSYTAQLLGQVSDAAFTGKAALDAGERSPFLMSTLAQIHYRMGYPQKAVEFGSFAAKYLYGKNLLDTNTGVYLPLTINITDTPDALANAAITKTAKPDAQPLTDPGITVPPMPTANQTELPRFEIVSPAAGSHIHGSQRVQVMYRGQRQITFVTFLVDNVLSGMASELPYQFSWNADTVASGDHRLTARAYDVRGNIIDEAVITVTSSGGKPTENLETNKVIDSLQQRMVKLTMPTPSPLSLFTNLGMWHLEQKEIPQAIDALEKSAAIDPDNDSVLQTLKRLYKENGLHPISATGEVVRGPATGGRRVALTFDDGPNPMYTPTIISELAQYNAHGTFFLVGKMVKLYPDLALELLANGHELANHTYNHPNLTKLQPKDILREVLLDRALIKDITGRTTYLFRPPGGNIDEMVTRELRDLDYNIIYWSINAGDYHNYSPSEQASLILAKVQDGSVLLLHNGPIDGTMNILPTLLAELSRRGYTFVTVSELMKGK
ncbi:MAG TPA: polysaccharide deacetylase family protein [Armatimonadota bacterium]|nr:polysaccharide deacetylase family protein [Armatimonadota bacterium]